MGILDDAIREHLDLKRRLGADDHELKRLEDEAFGPPTRPGDPDFPETDPGGQTLAQATEAPVREQPEPTTEGAAAETPAIDSPPVEDPAPESQPPPDLPAEPGPDTGETQIDPEPEPVEPAVGANAPEPPATEAATAFYDQAGESGTAESDTGEQILDAEVVEPGAPAEPDVVATQAASEPTDFDEPSEPVAESGPSPDLVNQPTIEHPAPEGVVESESPEPEAELINEPVSEELPAVPQSGEPPIESLDTVEHPFEGAITDTGETELVEGEIEEPADEGEEDGEDVLDQTPEFLRDQPEDDELWFEQGEPKDFDF